MAQTVVIEGLKSRYYITRGYGPAKAITLVVAPSSVQVVPDAVVHLSSNIASFWVTAYGSIVPDGDGLGATWTAPGSDGSGVLTVTDKTDPGNRVTVPLIVLSAVGTLTQPIGIQGLTLGVTRIM